MFVGSMMIPEPIMLTATMNVSCVRLIFFCSAMISPALDGVAVTGQSACRQLASRHALAPPRRLLARGGRSRRDTAGPTATWLEPQAVDIGLEAGELLVELSRVEQVVLRQ